jgi:hypothetical protein
VETDPGDATEVDRRPSRVQWVPSFSFPCAAGAPESDRLTRPASWRAAMRRTAVPRRHRQATCPDQSQLRSLCLVQHCSESSSAGHLPRFVFALTRRTATTTATSGGRLCNRLQRSGRACLPRAARPDRQQGSALAWRARGGRHTCACTHTCPGRGL